MAENEEQEQKKFERRYGTRTEVFDQTAEMTRGGLRKDDLMISRSGRIVSKKKSQQATEAYKKWGFSKRKALVEEEKKTKKKIVRRKRKKKTEE